MSGMFYPGNPEQLRSMIKGFLNKAEPPKIEGQLKGLIVPHAGYEYSGQVAAFAYGLLKDKKFDSIIILGYPAVSFSTPASVTQGVEQERINSGLLEGGTKKELLKIARQSLEIYLKEKRFPELEVKEPALLEKRGAFVTLKKKGMLRGCIGNFKEEPLYIQIQRTAVSSALNDPRFIPVRLEELKDIQIEISVLSPMQRINSIEELELGRHGIYVTDGVRSGVFLPQVAEETGWTKEEFLRRCLADKAGLPPDAWEKGASVFVFTAEVFSEDQTNN